MEIGVFKIQLPIGYEIDREKSTFGNIVFKKKEEKIWRELGAIISGYYIDDDSKITERPRSDQYYYCSSNYNIFATEKQAKSALAMARISQIMANDERFGGPVTDQEWQEPKTKYIIQRVRNHIDIDGYSHMYSFLAFHTREQRDLFLKENEDLVKDYLMID